MPIKCIAHCKKMAKKGVKKQVVARPLPLSQKCKERSKEGRVSGAIRRGHLPQHPGHPRTAAGILCDVYSLSP
jgi:hypothetical protein